MPFNVQFGSVQHYALCLRSCIQLILKFNKIFKLIRVIKYVRSEKIINKCISHKTSLSNNQNLNTKVVRIKAYTIEIVEIL